MRCSQHLLGEAKSAVEDVRRELRAQAAAAGKLGNIETRLSSLEGSILSAGKRQALWLIVHVMHTCVFLRICHWHVTLGFMFPNAITDRMCHTPKHM
jgi:hypothetical protein